ncbi:MAG: class I SAM-dependent methyltransferase [Candidatus Heimdallarchaeota archaeon]
MFILFVLQVVVMVFTLLIAWILLLKLIRRFWKFPIPAILTGLIDNPIRRKIQPPKILADRMRLQPDMFLLEVGPGKGTYTLEVAKRIPNGKIIAIDIQESVVRKLKEKCEELGITNVEPKVMDVYNLDFDNEVFDRAFLISCLPEIPNPIRALRELNRVLKPNGLLCLVEAFPDPDYPLPRTEFRWAKDAGFTLDSRHGNWFIYYLILSKSN